MNTKSRIYLEPVSSITEDTKINGNLVIKLVHRITGQITWGIGFYVGWYGKPRFEVSHGLKRYFEPVAYGVLDNIDESGEE